MTDDYDPGNHRAELRDVVSGICVFVVMLCTLLILSLGFGQEPALPKPLGPMTYSTHAGAQQALWSR